MPSTREQFFEMSSFVVIGDSRTRKPFPRLTYRGLRSLGKCVYAVDPGASEVEGDRSYPDLASLPGPVEAAVLEVPKAETAAWVERVADAGIGHLWIHWGTETPEAISLAVRRGLRVETGACAVMYVTPGFTGHSVHRWIMKLLGKY